MKKIIITGILSSMIMINACKSNSEKPAIDPANMDLSVSPSQDFYRYANGGWMKNNPLKPEYGRYGSFDKLAEDNQERIKVLAEKLAGDVNSKDPIARKTGLFFKTANDSVLAENAGLTPIQPILEKIDLIGSKKDLQDMISYLHTVGISPLFSLFAESDSKNSSLVIAWIFQGGIGMPDRDYYVEDNERAEILRKAYLNYIKDIFTIYGTSSSEARQYAEQIMAIETRLARASMTRLDMRDPNAIYHKMSRSELSAKYPAFNWDSYFTSLQKTETGDVNLAQPEFFEEMNKMLDEVPLQEWKTYLKWHTLNNMAPYLTNAFATASFNFYGKELSGKQEMEPRWKRAVNSCDEALGMALGQVYVKEYFPPEAKTRMLSLVENLRSSLQERIGLLDWMSDTTKAKAIEKLQAMKLKIGYPDVWRDYTALEISGESFAGNILSAAKFNMNYMLSKINKPADPEEWGMTPQTVNAYYNPSKNEIVFPAGILQPPFFYLDADDAVNYGAIGMVIGHEMTHGFDDQGRLYDKVGNLTDWWTAEDARRFNERTEKLVKQYSSYIVLDSLHADGKLTLGENIADLGGMFVSITAFGKTGQAKSAEKTDGFTPIQRFFLAYAHVWAQNIRDKEILRRTKEDVHSLGNLRVIGPLRNMPQFYEAFGVKEGDPMYLNEQERTLIW
ncbi:MAG: M13 family metallopeptidase [Bacteroidales bacterium]